MLSSQRVAPGPLTQLLVGRGGVAWKSSEQVWKRAIPSRRSRVAWESDRGSIQCPLAPDIGPTSITVGSTALPADRGRVPDGPSRGVKAPETNRRRAGLVNGRTPPKVPLGVGPTAPARSVLR